MIAGACKLIDLERLTIDDVEPMLHAIEAWDAAGARIEARLTKPRAKTGPGARPAKRSRK